jgi:putative acetyltransferase
VHIGIEDVSSEDVIGLLQEHLTDMYLTSPPESVHALDLDALRQPQITFWTIREQTVLAGCAALKELEAGHAEIKSMRTAAAFRRKGVARRLLQHIIAEARRRNIQRLSLETGSMDYFAPARALYTSVGFAPCSPFADYKEDPNSIFMSKNL